MDTSSKILLGIIVVQGAVIVAQHLFFSHEIHKLIDKLMSRDFADYKRAASPPEPVKPPTPDYGPPEDLSTLQSPQLPF